MQLKILRNGDRVQLHPATDQWMRGERYAEVISFNPHTHRVRIKTDYGNIYIVSEGDVL